MSTADLSGAQVVPVLRIFDETKAREFWLGFMGFTLDWEHRFDANAPLYMQVSRGPVTLHLSEHHGDGTPGSNVIVRMRGLDAFNAELLAKQYKYMRPGIEERPWGMRDMTVIDPFQNRICFSEPMEKA
ncbi:MAG: VOC family protein [Hyphomicrobiales bacterium]|nr:MAG: VOC family protein [Hyphomicrobiales bacterium]